MDDTPSTQRQAFPTPDEVGRVFEAHYAYFRRLRGIAADSAANGEAAVSRQYAGRVPFELLQNALDRAESRVMLRQAEGRLVVANDGRAVSCDPSFLHNQPVGEGNQLSDFHALCSLHTSNKSPDDSYGNKGVGFRSVFSVARRVEVWSRHAQGGWWGLLLLRDLDLEAWSAARDEELVAAGLGVLLPHLEGAPLTRGERRPSFHFPLPLWSTEPPVPGLAWSTTFIHFPCEDASTAAGVAASLESLGRSHLEFVGLRGRPPVTVEVGETVRLSTRRSPAVVDNWTVTATDPPPALFEAAHKAGLEIHKHIGGAVRWPEPHLPAAGRVYCYLATEVPCPFGIDLHADLQTGIDRKHLELKATEAVGTYNRQLLLRGLEAHLRQVHAQAAHRDDLFRLLDPGPGLRDLEEETEPVRHLLAWAMGRHLFGTSDGKPGWSAESWSAWAELAAACFNGRPRPARAWRQFWTATEHWINAAEKSHYKAARQRAGHCLEALRRVHARVLPITAQAEVDDDFEVTEAIEPPAEPGQGGSRALERLFHMTEAQREYLGDIEVPVAIRDRERRVTAWRVPEPFRKDGRLLGSVPFQRAALLQELRQLSGRPLDPEGHDAIPSAAADKAQLELIAFAATIFALPVRDGQTERAYADLPWEPGWRADYGERPPDRFSAGRALATLFLPASDGSWAPARQLSARELAPSLRLHLAPILTTDAHYQGFLRFIGVAAWQGELPLVEGGEAGLEAPRRVPPPLCEAATGLSIPPLSIPELDPVALRLGLELAWAPWLRSLCHRELDRPDRYRVVAELRVRPIIPVGEGPGDARPPTGLRVAPTLVAPGRLTLLSRSGQRVEEALWRISGGPESWLWALGARPLEERLAQPEAAAELLIELSRAYPDPGAAVRSDPRLRFVLVELFNRALETVAKAEPERKAEVWTEDLPLLAEVPGVSGRSSRLAWCRARELVVAPDRASRDTLRRLARALPLLVATVGPKQARGTPLQGRVLEVQAEVQPGELFDDGGVRTELRGLLPKLLALAEVSRRYNRLVDPHTVAERWRLMDLHRSRDVWRRWTIRGGGIDLDVPDRKGQYDDVMHVDRRHNKELAAPSAVYFDVPPDRAEGPQRPPLPRFAEALAEILLDRAIEPDWQAALGELEAGGQARLDEHLARHGVQEELVETMEAGLAPLATHLLPGHLQCVVTVLAGFGLQLVHPTWDANSTRTLHLGLEVLPAEGGPAEAHEDEVNAALKAAPFEEAARSFIPRLQVSDHHLAAWEALLGAEHLHKRLLRYRFDQLHSDQPRPADPVLEAGPLARDLRQLVAERAAHLRFDAEAIALSWLGLPPARGPLAALLPAFTTYDPVEAITETPTWTALPAREARPSTSTATPPTDEETAATDAAKVAKGDAAEEALLKWVLETTQAALAAWNPATWDPAACSLLLSGYPASGLARERAVEALAQQDPVLLRQALWVSRTWRGSGYDIIGLDRDPVGLLRLRRFEVKALPDATNVRLFLSRNELAVYRATREPGTATRPDLRAGTWDLVGVRPSGAALVLTGALAPVRHPTEGGLGALRLAGFAPDDLQLVLRLDPSA